MPPPDELAPYERQPLDRSAEREVILMRWRAGATSAAHDHGQASGRIFVVDGTIEERSLEVTAEGLIVTAVRRVSAPAVLEVAAGVVHEMHAVDAAMTLHVYAPAVDAMRIWDPAQRAVLVVDEDQGAWLPPPERVIARLPWGPPRAVSP